jgi:phosphoribosylglycinamide formyltransferase-1
MMNILLFASGGGSNVNVILNNFKQHENVRFPMVVTNHAEAGVIDVAKHHGVDVMLINQSILSEEMFVDTIDFFKPHLIVLAGFLLRIPDYLVAAYPNKIINIHPALLPKYGGKGMYGLHVHEAVLANHEKESGITVHIVNENYDEGTILLQKKLKITKTDTPTTLAAKVLALEHEWYSKVIESLLVD